MSIRFGRSGGNYSSSEVMQTEDDDWRKITDVNERRKIQNRLAQRNYRRKLRRKLNELEEKASGPSRAGRASRVTDVTDAGAASLAGVVETPNITSNTIEESSVPAATLSGLEAFLDNVEDIININSIGNRVGNPFSLSSSDFGPLFGTNARLLASNPSIEEYSPPPRPPPRAYQHPGHLIPPSFEPSHLSDPSTHSLSSDSSTSSNLSVLSRGSSPFYLSTNLPPNIEEARRKFTNAIATVKIPPDFPGLPNPTFTPSEPLPLGVDHKFITISTSTIFNAGALNAYILSIDTLAFLDDDCLSPFNMENPPELPKELPEDLIPTALQKQIPHHPYIDIIPFSNFRDKILRFMDLIDESEICSSMYTDWAVWGSTPWDKMSWEVGEKFATRYWFLLDDDMKRSTNFWRRQRGLAPLKVPISSTSTSSSTGNGGNLGMDAWRDSVLNATPSVPFAPCSAPTAQSAQQ